MTPPNTGEGAKLYAPRDTEALGSHYTAHLEAMTAEGLHDKSAIAAELAWRDQKLAAAETFKTEIIAERNSIRDRLSTSERDLEAVRELLFAQREMAAVAQREREQVEGLMKDTRAYMVTAENRATALAAQLEAARKLTNFIRANCKVVYFQSSTAYPIEHTMQCIGGKDMWQHIEDAAVRTPAAPTARE